ncbi:MAG: hypothetical protein V1723_02360 [Candidatus Uhrbacteria bacterium]
MRGERPIKRCQYCRAIGIDGRHAATCRAAFDAAIARGNPRIVAQLTIGDSVDRTLDDVFETWTPRIVAAPDATAAHSLAGERNVEAIAACRQFIEAPTI